MYNPNENPYNDPVDQFTRPPKRAGSPMATAAITCGIIGIISCFSVYGGILFGSLAIVFALLSRGKRKKERMARTGLAIGLIAIIISVVLVIVSFVIVTRTFGSFENFYKKYLYTMEQNYGMDLEDLYDQLPDFSPADQMPDGRL